MNVNKIELPSNKKFGFFFTLIFSVVSIYFFSSNHQILAFTFIVFTIIFFILSVFKSDYLLPLNKLWIRFGLILGSIINPIILGLIFFGIFTPTAFLMRLCKRDELNILFTNKKSHWIIRKQLIEPESFKRQF